MEVFEIILIALGLGMDSFAVAICKGLAMKKMNLKKAIIIGIYFGAFQAVMPIIGYFLGINFQNVIVSIDHWIAFILLGGIGANMLKEAFSKEEDNFDDSVNLKTMLVLAIATSIDALAVGITFAFLQVNIILAVSIIGVMAFTLSIVGVKLGSLFGDKFEKQAEILGGTILILMGVKILVEHLYL